MFPVDGGFCPRPGPSLLSRGTLMPYVAVNSSAGSWCARIRRALNLADCMSPPWCNREQLQVRFLRIRGDVADVLLNSILDVSFAFTNDGPVLELFGKNLHVNLPVHVNLPLDSPVAVALVGPEGTVIGTLRDDDCPTCERPAIEQHDTAQVCCLGNRLLGRRR